MLARDHDSASAFFLRVAPTARCHRQTAASLERVRDRLPAGDRLTGSRSRCDLPEFICASYEICRRPLHGVRRKEYLPERSFERLQAKHKVQLLQRMNVTVIQAHPKLVV